MEFKYVPEPYCTEISSYLRQRAPHIHLLPSTAEVQQELLRPVMEGLQQVDRYPKGRQLLQDEEYLAVLKDMINLSSVLDDMEQTGAIPFYSRANYYNVYSRLYKLLASRAKQLP